MNRYIHRVSRMLTLGLLCLLWLVPVVAQTAPDIQFPDLYPGQQIKGPVLIHSNLKTPGSDRVLTKEANSNGPNWKNRSASPTAQQLWFIVQDYSKNAFALVSAQDKSWLYFYDNNPGSAFADTPVLDNDGNAILAHEHYYFNFLLPRFNKVYNLGVGAMDSAMVDMNVPGTQKLYAICLADDENKLLYTLPAPTYTWWAGTQNQASSGLTYRLEPYAYPGGISPFQALPFQASAYHNSDVLSLGGGEKLSRISRNTLAGNKAKDVLLSYHALVTAHKDDTLLKMDFSGADNAYIGWLSYEKATYSQGTIQSNIGDRAALPRFGVGVANNKLYAIREGYTDTLTSTGFQKNYPVVVSIQEGKMELSQKINGATVITTLYDVSVSSILSGGIGSKCGLVARLQGMDTILVGYKPGNWIFSAATAGTQVPFITSTNPDLPMSPDAFALVNNFDWRSKVYKLRYKSNGQTVTEMVSSPFFTGYPEFVGISAKYTPVGKHSGGEDNNPYSGWELIKNDFGYVNDGTEAEISNLRAEPYMILYNRYLGKLRVFVYLNNNSIANNYKLTLSVANLGMYGDDGNGANGKYKPPFLWSSYLQGKPLDDTTLTAPDYYKAQQLNSTSSGRFYYTDFQMNYDPCVAFFESAIQVKVDKLTQGTMSIVGRSLGGSIPGSTAINDWMAKNGNFLAGALNSNYGSLSQTMGDLTLNNYRQWGMDSLNNYARFTLPGKKVSPWEKEEAYLKWTSESVKATGTFIVASGTLIGGLGEMADASMGPFSLLSGGNPGKAMKAAGKFVEAAGKFTEASGTAMSARSLQIRYENLKDQPDQNIPVKMPDPQPSLVYSDLALQGTLTIQSPVFSNVYFTTPGSRNAKFAPESRPGSGAKGDFPMYNEPLGLYNLLTTPRVGLAVSGHTAMVALKEYPVVVLNGRISGISNLSPSVQLAVTTYDTSGIARRSASTRAYTLTGNEANLDSYDRLPAIQEINSLIDWETIDTNILRSGNNLTDQLYTNKLARWIKVELVLGLNLFAGKGPDGNYLGSVTTMAFPVKTIVKASVSGDTPVETLTGQFGYNRDNNAFFGSNRIFNGSDTAATIRNLMNSYCNTHQANQILMVANTSGRPAGGDQGDTVKNNTGKIVPRSATYAEELKLYPNPAQDECNLAYIAKCRGEILIELVDINGRCLVKHRDFAGMDGERKAATVHMAPLPPGIYAIKVRFNNGSYYTGKIVKR